MMRGYRLGLQETADSTGYFTAVPDPDVSIDQGLTDLRAHPNDSFMHAHLLERIGGLNVDAAGALMDSANGRHPVVRALILEAALLYTHLTGLKKHFGRQAMQRLAEATPLIFLRSERQPDQSLHRDWAALFQANLLRHRPLPPPEKTGLAYPVDGVDGSEPPLPEAAHLTAVIRGDRAAAAGHRGTPRPPVEETIDNALSRLTRLDIFDGPEMRHQASLSPIALLRKWRFDNRIRSGGLSYALSSVQTSYGRGLSLASARAACLMEVVERCSAFVGVDGNAITGTRRPHPLLHGSLSALSSVGHAMLDPNLLGLEVPYDDNRLYWIEGEQLTPAGSRSIWVPAQAVFLFCNLDERALFSGLGSTGLASGNTMAEARLSALYELLERDSEAVNPFHPSRCFRIWAEDEKINALLSDYRVRGIHLQFQDISPAFGIPCCSCFVTRPDGTVARGGGANLDGRRAVLSALTETPYPYPEGPLSAPGLPDLPWLQFENLPDFSTGCPDLDLMRVEKTLMANGYAPVYIDITRKDLDIPVVKALLPGLEMMADFDHYCRISSRLFNNYLKMHKIN